MSKPISMSIGWITSITISASSMVALVISILLSILFYVHSMTRQCWCWLHCLTGGHCHMSVWMMGMLRKAATSDAKQVWDFDRQIDISLLKNHPNLYSFLLLPFFCQKKRKYKTKQVFHSPNVNTMPMSAISIWGQCGFIAWYLMTSSKIVSITQ